MDKDIKHIIEACIQNDRHYQEILYKRYFGKMMSMCLRYTSDRDEAMMILNDGFLKVFKYIHTFQHKGSFEGWVRRLIFNSLSDYFKKKNKQIKFLELGQTDFSGYDDALEKLYIEDISKLIEHIPKASADVFSMYAIYGFTHKEIGTQLNISEGTSKWHLSNARKFLQKLIKQNYSSYSNGETA